MNTRIALLTLLPGLASIQLCAAEPAAPKLVPRPIPGFAMPRLPKVPLPPGPAPAQTAAAPAALSAAEMDPEVNNRARIRFIHRRATLPAKFTADLDKPVDSKGTRQGSASQASAVLPGKIRIIPKSEVATLITPLASSKPAAP